MMTADYIWDIWCKIQENRPLVHCITNMVTVNDCANILLAAGASPTMAHHPMEVEEVTEACDSLVCNMGATEYVSAMEPAGKHALKMKHPIVLDPVGTAGSSYRRNSCGHMIKEIKPTCIRGNFSEIKALFLGKSTGAGVDASKTEMLQEEREITEMLAEREKCIVAASGETDIVSDGKKTFLIKNGSSLMAKITGAGCMSSALLGAFLAAEDSLEAVVAACCVMGICGEIAEEKTRLAQGGTGTFRVQLIDAVSLMKKEEIQNRMQLEMIENED